MSSLHSDRYIYTPLLYICVSFYIMVDQLDLKKLNFIEMQTCFCSFVTRLLGRWNLFSIFKKYYKNVLYIMYINVYYKKNLLIYQTCPQLLVKPRESILRETTWYVNMANIKLSKLFVSMGWGGTNEALIYFMFGLLSITQWLVAGNKHYVSPSRQ